MSFKEDLKVIPIKQEEYKAEQVEAYKNFISEALPGYIEFMKALNHTITHLEANGIIGKTKLRTRLKAINSALKNTEGKTLDDVFGFEIVTENERDKEILMLIIHNIFVGKYAKQKNHNKSNGYFAHHCTGAIKNQLDGTEVAELEKHILDAETNELKTEYRDMPKAEQIHFKKSEIFKHVPRYPTLRQEILECGTIDENLQENFEWALGFMDQYLNNDPIARKNMPICEIQFKTTDVEQEAKYGRAQHDKYKNVNKEEIRKRYFQKQLVRGVDYPFTFIRNTEGDLEIEHSSETVMSMWPFLRKTVLEQKQTNSFSLANYDLFFAKIFPALEPYVQKSSLREPSVPVNNFSQESAWNILKSKIINDKIFSPNPNQIEEMGISEK